jgi:hypothetical protein
MERSLMVCALLVFATPAFAEDQKPAAPAGGMDMSKMGPWSRKPKDEKQVKKEVAEFFKAVEDATKKGDHESMVTRIDFPVYMMTDDSKGTPEAESWDKDKYVATMKPFWENSPKDVKWTHKPTVTVLSDALVNVVDDFTMTAGKQKLSGKSISVLVKRDGQWKWKVMGEAGWGGMNPPQAAQPAAQK